MTGRWGIRGTTSGLFPVFSDAASRARFIRGEDARSEASTDELRQLVDEVGWLLGTQFTIQVIPAVAEAAAEVLCGAVDAVLKLGRERLQHRGVVRVDEPVDAVIVSVPSSHGLAWKQLGLALDQATRVVTSDGRIIVIADLPEPVGPAATLLRRCHEPFELLKPLRNEPMPDGLEVSQLIHAIEHARVFLHSRLPNDLVEELRMMPVSDAAEFSRLVAACGADTIVIPNANYASCELIQPGIRSASARSTVS